MRKIINYNNKLNGTTKKLQKELSEHEERVQMRGDILKIYNDFCYAQSVIGRGRGQINVIFSNFSSYNASYAPNIPMQWINDVHYATSSTCQAVNRSKLLLPPSDEDLRNVLEEMYEKIKEVRDKAEFYYNSGNAYSASETAWNTITPSSGILKYNYPAFGSNQPAYDSFLKLCINDSTKGN